MVVGESNVKLNVKAFIGFVSYSNSTGLFNCILNQAKVIWIHCLDLVEFKDLKEEVKLQGRCLNNIS